MSGRVGLVGTGSAGLGSAGLGFYVHHHGRGHANRARQIIPHLRGPVTVFSSSVDYLQGLVSDRVRVIQLPSDITAATPHQDWPDVLHYAPLEMPGIRERMYLLAEWAYRTNPALLVVDVSVEITLFARLLSVPTVVMRQNGRRDDLPHRTAYQSCRGLLAPYPATLEEDVTPRWVRNKTYYAGGFSRYADRSLTRTQARQQLGMRSDHPYVVVMSGLGGSGNPLTAIRQAAQVCPRWEWWVVGPTSLNSEALPPNVTLVGWVDDTFSYLKGADVVVASAGNNTVMEVATAGTPYVCIPEARPFDEQHGKAERLDQTGAALVLAAWPEASRWPELLAQAQQQDTTALTAIVDPQGARKCAYYLQQMMRA